MAAQPKTSKKNFPKGEVLRLSEARLSYPHIWVPQDYKDAAGIVQSSKYGTTFLLDPKKPHCKKAIKAVEAEIDRMLGLQWKLSRAKLSEIRMAAAKKGKPVPAHQDIEIEFMGDGNDYTDDSGAIRDGYKDMIYIKAKSDRPPLIVDKDKDEVSKNHPDSQGGKYTNSTINLYIQDDTNGKAIRCALRGIILLGYGKPFGNTVDAKELSDFEDFDAADDDGEDDEDEEGDGLDD
jgi:hypothetical protein